MSELPPKKNYLVDAWLVLTLSLVFAAGLAIVQIALADKIEQNKKDDTERQIPALVGLGDGPAPTVIPVPRDDSEGAPVAYQVTAADGTPAGWVLKAKGQGFADKIELLVGLDPTASKVLGLYVLDQKETPGLGNKISDRDWRTRFKGKSATTDIVITKTKPKGNEVQAVTGATVSSVSVARIVNIAVIEFRNDLHVHGKYKSE